MHSSRGRYEPIKDLNVARTKILQHLTISLLLLLPFVSCDRCIYEDLSACPQGMEFAFVSRTPCNDKLSLDRMTGLMLQIYDEKGLLVKEYEQKDLRITPDFKFAIPFATPGTYTFAFWGMEGWQPYKRASGASCGLAHDVSVISETLPSLFYGSLSSHKIIDRSNMGTIIEFFEINMLPYTHNFNIEVSGLSGTKNYTVIIESNNAAYDYKGQSLKIPISYLRKAKSLDGSIKVSMNTLRQERDGNTVIKVKDTLSGKELLSIPLEALIRGIEAQSGRVIRLECVQDLDIKLEILTHESIKVTLNQWNFVYRTVILR